MPTTFKRTDPPEGAVFTATTDNGTAVAVFDNLQSGVLPPEVESANATVIASLDQLNSKVVAIVDTAHPRLVNEQVFEAIKKTIAGPINRLILAGQTAVRENAEAFERAAKPVGQINEQLRSNLQTRLLNMDTAAIMRTLNKTDASLELIIAALDTAEVTGLPDDYVQTLRERLILKNSERIIASDAAAIPTPQEPFATGIDPEKSNTLAQGMLDNHRAKVAALDAVEASVSRVVIMLALLSGVSGPDVIWAAIRP